MTEIMHPTPPEIHSDENTAVGSARPSIKNYFSGIIMRNLDVMRMHFYDNKSENNPRFKYEDIVSSGPNSSIQHCLMEAARARALGKLLGLDENAILDLEKAALLHDSFKARESQIMHDNGPGWDSYEQAQSAAHDAWKAAGFSGTITRIGGSVGHGAIDEIVQILSKSDETLTLEDKQRLAMYYIDDFTINSGWARPAGIDGNDLDRRIDKNERNKNYAKINEDGLDHFRTIEVGINGIAGLLRQTTYQRQRLIGHTVEARLSNLICAASKLSPAGLDPIRLPEIIDSRVKEDVHSSDVNNSR